MKLKTILILITFFLFSPMAHAITTDVTDISNRLYFDAVINEINNAKQTIDVAMYSAYLRYNEPDKPAYKLVQALVNAQKRGVKVEVYLNKSAIGKNPKRLEKGNDEAFKILQESKVPVAFIRPELKLHAKLIVIDSAVVIEGSSNWTDNAVLENAETNSLMRSPTLAVEKLKFFAYLKTNLAPLSELKRELLAKVIVPNYFLTDCAGPILTKKGVREFDLYLLLLRDWQYTEHGEWMDVDFTKVATQAAIPIENKYYEHRQKIRASIKELKDKYNLLDYQFDTQHNVRVRFPAKPKNKYFSIPLAYWQYGFNFSLTSGERLFFLISLHEADLVRPKPYWRRSIPGLTAKYHMANNLFSNAITGLRRGDIIEVQYDSLKGWGRDATRAPNQYRLKPLVSPQEKNAQWDALDVTYTRDRVNFARALLALIDMGNNVAATREIILLVNECGKEPVKKAFAKVALFEHSNPLRGVDYIRALARKAVRESN
jgi:hypothetical protein